MRLILFDSNVILDHLLERQDHFPHAATLFKLVAGGRLDGAISGATVTDIWYLVQRQKNRHVALDACARLAGEFAIIDVGRSVVEVALADVRADRFRDFEDAVQHAAAEAAGAEAIVTRNVRDFAEARIEVLTPARLLAKL